MQMTADERRAGIVEVLREAQGLVSVRRLSDHFQVSPRTIHYDISAIEKSGISVGVRRGRSGGFYIRSRETRNNDAAERAQNRNEQFPIVGYQGVRRLLSEIASADRLAPSNFVALIGVAGIGKSRLAEELRQRIQPIVCGFTQSDKTVGFEPWHSILRQLNETNDPVSVVHSSRLSVTKTASQDAREQLRGRYDYFTRVFESIRAACTRGRVSILFEDIHWADEASATLLEFIIRRAHAEKLHLDIVITTRPRFEAENSELIGGVLNAIRDTSGRLHELEGLDRTECAELASTLISTELTPAFIDRLFEKSLGNPLFVTEYARLIRSGSSLENAVLPGLVRDLLERRLTSLDPSTRKLLESASMLQDHVDLQTLRNVYGSLRDDDLIEAVEDALESRILKETSGDPSSFEFTHPLFPETIRASIKYSQKVRKHSWIAARLESLYGEHADSRATEIAFHLRHGQPVSDPRKLIQYSIVAGNNALAAFAWEDARLHFETALNAKGSIEDTETAEALLGLEKATTPMSTAIGTPVFNVANFENLIKAFHIFLEAGETANAIETASRPPIGSIQNPEYFLMQESALELVAPGSLDHARVLTARATCLSNHELNPDRAIALAMQALRIGDEIGDDAVQIRALHQLQWTSFIYGERHASVKYGEDALKRAEQATDIWQQGGILFFLVHAGLCLGLTKKVRVWASQLQDVAEKTQAHNRLWQSGFANAVLAGLTGDDVATLAIQPRISESDRSAPMYFPQQAFRHFLRNEHKIGYDLLASTEQLLNRDLHAHAKANFGMRVAVIANLIKDERLAQQAKELIESEVEPRQSPHPSSDIVRAIGRGSSAAVLKDKDRARDAYLELIPYQKSAESGFWNIPTSIDRLLGTLAAVLGDPSDAASHFEDAIAFCDAAGFIPEAIWTRLEFADFQLNKPGRPPLHRVGTLTAEAERLAHSHQLRYLERWSLSLQQQIGASSRVNTFALTNREREVLQLLGQGMTDRQIAEALIVSVHTASGHVRSILSKTGTRTRTEAARQLASQ